MVDRYVRQDKALRLYRKLRCILDTCDGIVDIACFDDIDGIKYWFNYVSNQATLSA